MTSWRDMWMAPGPQDCRADSAGLRRQGPRLRGLRHRRGATRLPREQRHPGLLPHRRVARRVGGTRADLRGARRVGQARARRERRDARLVAAPARRGVSRARHLARPARVRRAAEASSRPSPSRPLRVTTSGNWRRQVARAPCVRSTPTRRARWRVSAPAVTDSGRAIVDRRPLRLAGRAAGRPAFRATRGAARVNILLIEVEPGVRLKAGLRRPRQRPGRPCCWWTNAAATSAGRRRGCAWSPSGQTRARPRRARHGRPRAGATGRAATPAPTSSRHAPGCSGRASWRGRRATSLHGLAAAAQPGARCLGGARCTPPDRRCRRPCLAVAAGHDPMRSFSRRRSRQLPRPRDRGRPRPRHARGAARRAARHRSAGTDGAPLLLSPCACVRPRGAGGSPLPAGQVAARFSGAARARPTSTDRALRQVAPGCPSPASPDHAASAEGPYVPGIGMSSSRR